MQDHTRSREAADPESAEVHAFEVELYHPDVVGATCFVPVPDEVVRAFGVAAGCRSAGR